MGLNYTQVVVSFAFRVFKTEMHLKSQCSSSFKENLWQTEVQKPGANLGRLLGSLQRIQVSRKGVTEVVVVCRPSKAGLC